VTCCWLDGLVFKTPPPKKQVPKATHPPVEWVLGPFPGVKQWGHVIDRPSPSSTKVVYGQSCKIIPSYFFLWFDGSELTILASITLPNQLQMKYLPQQPTHTSQLNQHKIEDVKTLMKSINQHLSWIIFTHHIRFHYKTTSGRSAANQKMLH